jgi:DNA helicase-2/ATP-dependent DNA helicase PcrA
LIASKACTAKEIVIVTFTTQAAEEMRNRLAVYIGSDAKDITVKTFHALALSFLRKYPHLAQREPNASVLDEGDALAALTEVINTSVTEFPQLEELWSTDPDEDPRKDAARVAAIAARISARKLALLPLEKAKLQAWFRTTSTSEAHALSVQTLLDHLYSKFLIANNALTFDDLIYYAGLAARAGTEFQEFARGWSYIMADEYQDTSTAQNAFLEALCCRTGNLAVVGDDDQLIHAWAGADVQLILGFQDRHPLTTVIRLERNYRCSPRILRAATNVIHRNQVRSDKTLRSPGTADTDGCPITVISVPSPMAEFQSIADKLVERQFDQGSANQDTAFILTRYTRQTSQMELALVRARIPYRLKNQSALWSRSVVQDVTNWARALDMDDLDALWSVVGDRPARGLGSVSVDRCQSVAKRLALGSASEALQHEDVMAAPATSAGKQALVEVQAAIDAYTKAITGPGAGTLSNEAVCALFRQFLSHVGVIAYWSEVDDSSLEILTLLLDEVERSGTLGSLIEAATLGLSFETKNPEPRVLLMTMHSSKGLEADHVFCLGWIENSFPAYQAVALEEESVVLGAVEIEAERRLAHVALTRARKTVTVTLSRFDTMGQSAKPSRFIGEIGLTEICWHHIFAEQEATSLFDATSKQRGFADVIERTLGCRRVGPVLPFLEVMAPIHRLAESAAANGRKTGFPDGNPINIGPLNVITERDIVECQCS